MYIIFVAMGIISLAGLGYLGYLDSNKITSASVVVRLIVKTPEYSVGNWSGGGRRSGSGTIDTPFGFFKKKKGILILPNGQYKNKFIDSNVFEIVETFNQSVFPEVIQLKDVNNSDFIQFKIGDGAAVGQMDIQSGTIEVSLNDTKKIIQVPAQTATKDVNGSLVSISLSE